MMMKKMIAAVLAAAVCAFGALVLPASGVLAEEAQSAMEQGKALAFDRKKGNCLACHMIAGGDLPGNIGPPLVAMKMRYPDKAKLRAQIYDATAANPQSSMPPFGTHGILTDKEIDLVTEFIYAQ
jgi:sulfur-oxidizing protein SoxX